MRKINLCLLMIMGLTLYLNAQVSVLNSLGASQSNGSFSAVMSIGETFVGSANQDIYGSLGILGGTKFISTSITDPDGIQYDVVVYPNPTTDYVSIKADIDILSYKIIDMQGRILINKKYQSGSQIDLTTLPPNIYILSIKTKSTNTFTVGYISKN